MDRDDQVKAVAAIAAARKGLKVLTSGGLAPVTGWRESGADVNAQKFNRFRPLFAEANKIDPDISAAAAEHCMQLQNLIREKRKALRSRPVYAPVSKRLMKTGRVASEIIKAAATRRARIGTVEAMPSPFGVRKSGTNDNISIGPMWLENVHQKGIATASWSSKTAFVLRAKPKSSAFLMAEGIKCWEATVYMPDGTRETNDGFVFRSEGELGFTQFSTDFMRGAATIRKRVSDAVLAKMQAV